MGQTSEGNLFAISTTEACYHHSNARKYVKYFPHSDLNYVD